MDLITYFLLAVNVPKLLTHNNSAKFREVQKDSSLMLSLWF